MKKKVYLLPVALAFLLSLGSVGCGNKQKASETVQETVTTGAREESAICRGGCFR